MSAIYRRMLAAAAAAVYVALPFDCVPDVMVPVGYLDDLAVVVLAVVYRHRLSPRPQPQGAL